MALLVTDHTTSETPGNNRRILKQISWGAIFAGAIIAVATQLMLGLLGIAVGAGSLNLMQDTNPLQGLGTGSIVWLAASMLISLFVGGWATGKLAAAPDRTSSSVHGVVTWGLASLSAAYIVTSITGNLISQAAGVVGKTASVVASGAKDAVAEAAKNIGSDESGIAFSWNQIQHEAENLLRQTGKPELQPKALGHQARTLKNKAEQSAKNFSNDPQSASTELSSLLATIRDRGENVLESVDREALASILVNRANMTQEQAETAIDQWNATLEKAKVKVAQLKEEVVQKARVAADATAKSVSQAATYTFIGLLLGLIGATLGAFLGYPEPRKDTSGSESIRRTLTAHETAA